MIAEPKSIKIIQNNEIFFDMEISGLKFTKDNKYLISAGEKIKYWNVDTWKTEKIYEFYTDTFNISNDNLFLVFSTNNTDVFLFDTNSEGVIHTFKGHDPVLGSGRNQYPNFIRYLALSNNNNYLVTVGNEQKAILWDMETKEQLNTLNNEIDPITRKVIYNVTIPVFTPNDEYIAMSHKIFSIPDYLKIYEFNDTEILLDDFAFNLFSNDGQLYSTASNNGYLRIWDWNNRTLISREHLHKYDFIFDITNNQRFIVTAGTDKVINIYDVENRKVVESFELEELESGFLPLVSIHPIGKIFAVSGPKGKIFIFDLQEVLASQSQVKEWKDYE